MKLTNAANTENKMVKTQKNKAAHLVPNRLGTKEEAMDKTPAIMVKPPTQIPDAI